MHLVLQLVLWLAAADSLLCMFILFFSVWVLSQIGIGAAFSKQNFMSTHPAVTLWSLGIKFNAAFREVATAKKKRGNTSLAACLFCTEVMLPGSHPEEALGGRKCTAPAVQNELLFFFFPGKEKHSNGSDVMRPILVRTMDREGQDHRGLVGSCYKILVPCWRTGWILYCTGAALIIVLSHKNINQSMFLSCFVSSFELDILTPYASYWIFKMFPQRRVYKDPLCLLKS